jgi:hypothetical protein
VPEGTVPVITRSFPAAVFPLKTQSEIRNPDLTAHTTPLEPAFSTMFENERDIVAWSVRAE